MGVVARVTHNSHSITWHGTPHYTSHPTAHITAPPHPTSHQHTCCPHTLLDTSQHTHLRPHPHHSTPTSGPAHTTAHPPQGTPTSGSTHLRPRPHYSTSTSGPRPHCTTDLGSLAQVANQFHKRVMASSQLLQHLFPWRRPASSFHGESFICVLHISRAHIH